MSKRLWGTALPFAAIVLVLASSGAMAQTASQTPRPDKIGNCDLRALETSEQEFLRLVQLRRAQPGAVSDEGLRRASADYVAKADECYLALYGSSTQSIDDNGLWYSPDGSQPFVTFGTKWGAGSPFAGGTNIPGPGIPGGTVTYSFMATGVDNGTHADANLAFSSLPTFSACFLTEITNAFAAWSAVANIQFVQVADNGVAFNAPGAAGDIRIGSHSFDGPSAVLAHAYYPPPNGTTASGDLHFDRAESWSCSAGPALIDIGIVAIHEIGHSIGLNHEQTQPAIMQPTYNPGVSAPLADDISAASSIYGAALPLRRTTDDFDGDGKTDLAVWRPSTGAWWLIRSSDGGGSSQQWGAGSTPYNDVPVAADYDGDGKADIAVWRSSTGVWYIIRSSDGGITTRQWGAGSSPYNDVPVPADYDGDGKADVAVWRSSTGVWYIVRSSDGGVTTRQWGAGYSPYHDVAVPADYDGDSKADIAVWRASTGVWYIIRSSDGAVATRQWGAGLSPYNDVAVPGDYDGDGKTDIAVWRSSTGVWYMIRSSDGAVATRQWGVSTDIPVPRAPR